MKATVIAGGLTVIAVVALLVGVSVRAADEVPRSFVASPDVYKVIGEDAQYRIIEATWKPGQKDKFHSHGATVATYWLTDCKARNHHPDGRITLAERKAGGVAIRAADLNHALENVGTNTCKAIIFEPK